MLSSRRTFLKDTAAGVGAAWGGLRILAEAGSVAAGANSPARIARRPANSFTEHISTGRRTRLGASGGRC